MPESLMSRIIWMSAEINKLKDQLKALSKNTDYKPIANYSKVGSLSDRNQITPIDVGLGIGKGLGGNIFWNNAELTRPKWGEQPVTPTIGFNKHSHSKFSGGALDANTLEIVEYETDENGNIINNEGIVNPHCQQFWLSQPSIAKEQNSNLEDIEKIGKLSLVFNPNSQTWGVSALEIDVEKCYLVRRDTNGNIILDDNGNQMKSPLLVSTTAPEGETEQERINRQNSDLHNSSVVWDKNARMFRFYATFAPAPEESEA